MLHVACSSIFPLAGEVQQQLEDVDEVQVERERAEHGELWCDSRIGILGVCSLIVCVS